MQRNFWKTLISKGAEVTKYSIERRCISTDSNWEEIGETNPNTFNYCDTKNVVYKREYQYRVFAFNKKGKSLPGGPTPGFLAEKRTRKFFMFIIFLIPLFGKWVNSSVFTILIVFFFEICLYKQ